MWLVCAGASSFFFASLMSAQHAKMPQLGSLPVAVPDMLVGFWLLFKGRKRPSRWRRTVQYFPVLTPGSGPRQAIEG
jgi:hypothetical protein